MADEKALFYDRMTHDGSDDDNDDDLDKFIDFRNRSSQTGLHSQDLTSYDHEVSELSSQSSQSIPFKKIPAAPLPAKLRGNYISNPEQLNKRLKLDKKNLTVSKSSRLSGYIILYWPVMPLEEKSGRKKGNSRITACKGAIEHGAELALAWDGAHRITHIVVDRNSETAHKHVLDSLKLESIPSTIQLVKSGWVHEIINGTSHVKEDHHRPSDYPSSRQAAPNTDPTKTMKRSANDTQPDSPGIRGFTRQPIEPPLSKKLKTVKAPLAEPSDHKPSLYPPPASISSGFMKQSNKEPARHMAILIANGEPETSHRHPADTDELKRLVKRQEQVLRDKQFTNIMSESSYATTNRNDKTEGQSIYSGDHEDDDIDDAISGSKPNDMAKKFLCAKENLQGSAEQGPNAALIDHLQSLASHYANRSADAFRAKSYREAISVIRKQTHQITTQEQALSLRRIGSSIAAKIEQFAQHGKIDLIENLATDPRQQAIQLFTGVYGVGQSTAETFYNRGLRTLEDLSKIDLHEHQRIGLEHYDDFKSRIPRAEVIEHVAYVTAAARKLSQHMEVVVGGSYRRGQADSGDIDFLITAPDTIVSETQLQKLVFEQLIPSLRKTGYVKADLTLPSSEEKASSKWLGAASLPNAKPPVWRRIDILLVPNYEWGAALLYFTGNDIFNRSMRLLARKKGGSLNQHGLYQGVVRDKQGKKTAEGFLVEGRDERKIFKALGVPWRPPHERCP